LAELSVEEAQSLARQFLTGKAGEGEIVQLRTALETDQTAALELLAQMQTALEDVAPAGLSVEQSALVLAQVESLIIPRIQHRGLIGLFKRLFGSKNKPLLAPPTAAAPAAPAAPAAAPPVPAPVPDKASKPAPMAPAPARSAEADLEETAPIGGPPALSTEVVEGSGEDDILPGPPPLRILPQSAAGAPVPVLPPLKGLPALGAPGAPESQAAGASAAAKPDQAVPAPAPQAAARPKAVPAPAVLAPPAAAPKAASAAAPARPAGPPGRARSLAGLLVLLLLLGALVWCVQSGLLTLPSTLTRWWKPAPAAPAPTPVPAPATPVPDQNLARRAPAAVPPRSEPLPAELQGNP
jgi:hypothetical protein